MATKPARVFTKVELIRNHDEPPILLDIEPTMRTIKHNGSTYHKMPRTARELDDGTWAGCYLWDGYRDYLKKKLAPAAPSPPPGPSMT